MTTYEARQERPCYLDWPKGSVPPGPYRRMKTSVDPIGKEFDSFREAEKYARRILGQRPGVPVEISRRINDRYDARIAIISRDALERTWTDILIFDPSI